MRYPAVFVAGVLAGAAVAVVVLAKMLTHWVAV